MPKGKTFSTRPYSPKQAHAIARAIAERGFACSVKRDQSLVYGDLKRVHFSQEYAHEIIPFLRTIELEVL